MLSRASAGLWSRRLLSNAAPATEQFSDSMDRLLSADLPGQRNTMIRKSYNKIAVIEHLTEWTPAKDDDLLSALSVFHSASSLKTPKAVVTSLSEKCMPLVNQDLEADQIIAGMTSLLQLGFADTRVYNSLSMALQDKIETKANKTTENTVSLNTVIALIVEFHKAHHVPPPKIWDFIRTTVRNGVGELEKSSDLLSLLNNWHDSDTRWLSGAVDTSLNMLPVMSMSEVCAVIKAFANHGRRDLRLLLPAAQKITESTECLSVNQIVALAASCSKLNFFDARIIRKIDRDLRTVVNQIKSWNDASSLINSFTRLRLGRCGAWRYLNEWAVSHVVDAPPTSLSIAVSGMARLGIEDGRDAAKALSSRLQRESAPTPDVWLTSVHALTFFDQLTPALAESVLNKDFVAALLASSKFEAEKVYKSLRLLQVAAHVRTSKSLGDMYKGPMVNKQSLKSYCDLDKHVNLARSVVHGGARELSACDITVISEVLHRLAPAATHIGAAAIDETGIVADAQIVIQKDECIDESGTAFAEGMLGAELLGVRTLAAEGVKPLIIAHSDLARCQTTAEKNGITNTTPPQTLIEKSKKALPQLAYLAAQVTEFATGVVFAMEVIEVLDGNDAPRCFGCTDLGKFFEGQGPHTNKPSIFLYFVFTENLAHGPFFGFYQIATKHSDIAEMVGELRNAKLVSPMKIVMVQYEGFSKLIGGLIDKFAEIVCKRWRVLKTYWVPLKQEYVTDMMDAYLASSVKSGETFEMLVEFKKITSMGIDIAVRLREYGCTSSLYHVLRFYGNGNIYLGFETAKMLILSCGHIICQSCIRKLALRDYGEGSSTSQRDEDKSCPFCNALVVVISRLKFFDGNCIQDMCNNCDNYYLLQPCGCVTFCAPPKAKYLECPRQCCSKRVEHVLTLFSGASEA